MFGCIPSTSEVQAEVWARYMRAVVMASIPSLSVMGTASDRHRAGATSVTHTHTTPTKQTRPGTKGAGPLENSGEFFSKRPPPLAILVLFAHHIRGGCRTLEGRGGGQNPWTRKVSLLADTSIGVLELDKSLTKVA